MHVLPLGYRTNLDGKPNVTLQNPSTEERNGFTVTPEYFEFLNSIDPTVSIEREDTRLRQLSDLGDNMSFTATEFGGRFLQLLDSRRTLGEIIQTVKDNALDDEVNAAAIAENERLGNSFDRFLIDEAYSFAKTLIDSGAATFEAKAA